MSRNNRIRHRQERKVYENKLNVDSLHEKDETE